MGQPFFWSMAIKMHFYFKCVFLIKSLNYFHMRQKKKKIPVLKRIKESSFYVENFQNKMVVI